jgi:hypothetical protein
MIDTVTTARPDVRFALEMITRDPLRVPMQEERYWVTRDSRDREPGAARVAQWLALPRAAPLPRTTGLSPDRAMALEDEHVRICTDYARETLGL